MLSDHVVTIYLAISFPNPISSMLSGPLFLSLTIRTRVSEPIANCNSLQVDNLRGILELVCVVDMCGKGRHIVTLQTQYTTPEPCAPSAGGSHRCLGVGTRRRPAHPVRLASDEELSVREVRPRLLELLHEVQQIRCHTGLIVDLVAWVLESQDNK